MPRRFLSVKVWRPLRKALREADGAPRIARGLAAGCFAAAFPLPGLQIPLSLIAAFLVRGNRVVAVLPQFLANAGTFIPMIYLEYRIGTWLWPASAEDAERALAGISQAADAWRWSLPLASTWRFITELGALGAGAFLPLLIGVLVLGTGLAAVAYPLTVAGVCAWRARRPPGPEPPLPQSIQLPAADGAALSDEQAIQTYAIYRNRFAQARSLQLLVDGREAYPEMLAAIDAAERSIDLETYILADDATGKRFGFALARAAERGVKTRLLIDAMGSLELPVDFTRGLVSKGVEVRIYHPLRLARPTWAINRRDHRKILVADGRVSFTGGLNLSDEYASKEAGGRGWRDTHVRIEGEHAARALLALFEQAWAKAKHEPSATQAPAGLRWNPDQTPAPFPPADVPPERTFADAAVQIVGNKEFANRRQIRRAYLHAIRNAKRYILIENAYFVPDRGIRRALYKAAKRGVVVAVAVARESDVELSAMAGRALYSEHLDHGVRLFEWPRGMLHAKTAVVDDAWAIAGSYNLNMRSLIHDLEAVAVVADAGFAKALREQTLRDLALCEELTSEKHERRSWVRMLKESLAFQMRYWL